MKSVFISMVLLCAAANAGADEPLRCEVSGLATNDAPVHFSVYASKSDFFNDRPRAEGYAIPTNGACAWMSPPLPAGGYVVRFFHDLNRDGVMDRSALGIPAEPMGYSNNPKPRMGPPVYDEILFAAGDGPRKVAMKPLAGRGRGGRFGTGLAVIYSESPYVGTDWDVIPIPFLSYEGPRFVFRGPTAGVRLGSFRRARLEALASMRFREVSESDSSELDGIHRRERTVDGGLRLDVEPGAGFTLGLTAQTDLLGRHNGQEVQFSAAHPFRPGRWILTPRVGLSWASENLLDYYYGVDDSETAPGRPAYHPSSDWAPTADFSVTRPIGKSWLFVLSGGVEWLPGEIRDSPIVEQDVLIRTFSGFVYRF